MPVRTFVMDMQLKELQSNFIDHADFSEYISAKELVTAEKDREQLQIMEREFFKIALKSKDKHFTQWKKAKTLPLSLAGEQSTATLIARWMTEEDFVPDDVVFYSPIHSCSIPLRQLLQFLTSEVTREDFTSLLERFGAGIKELALGKSLWDDGEQSADMKIFRKYVEQTYLPLPCHTQFVEAGVKEAKLVSATGREERLRSQVAVIRNNTVSSFVADAKQNTTRRKEDAKVNTPKVSKLSIFFSSKLCFEYLTLVAIL